MAGQQREQERIQQALRGDLDAFNDLVLHYQDYIFTVTVRIMGDPAAAADAVQDAFITAYNKLDSYRGGSFKSWLSRIATNLCYDELRRHKRRPAVSLEDLPSADTDDGPALPAPDESPEQTAVRHELNAAIQNCINALTADQRVVLVYCDVQGMSYQETADSVGIGLGTVKSRLSRARRAVRTCLQAVQELLPAEFRQHSNDG